MKSTAIDLYRIGDGSGAALHAVRLGIDIIIYTVNGVSWVRGTPAGGASTFSVMRKLRRQSNRWWKLSAGVSHFDLLTIGNDHGSHWLWEPAADMPLNSYGDLLKDVNGYSV